MQTWLISFFEYLQKSISAIFYPFLVWKEMHCLDKAIFSNKRARPHPSYAVLLSSAMVNSQLGHNCMLPPKSCRPRSPPIKAICKLLIKDVYTFFLSRSRPIHFKDSD